MLSSRRQHDGAPSTTRFGSVFFDKLVVSDKGRSSSKSVAPFASSVHVDDFSADDDLNGQVRETAMVKIVRLTPKYEFLMMLSPVTKRLCTVLG
ncbi:hypothetical protein TIFTF001_025860 [Ficus carica]|uniref:Uncharacterized protein n=1 Tax=Ficus carica TaxID=3494 RepID=A0AA88DEK8_FICCA|nr:hypothetical protein TIFTF001_025860 [Ficus carica]